MKEESSLLKRRGGWVLSLVTAGGSNESSQHIHGNESSAATACLIGACWPADSSCPGFTCVALRRVMQEQGQRRQCGLVVFRVTLDGEIVNMQVCFIPRFKEDTPFVGDLESF